MKRVQRILVILLIVCFTFPAFPAAAQTASSSSSFSKRWNIMIVVDASGSLQLKSDTQGLRFEAIDQFLDSLQEDMSNSSESGANYVGAITFGANITDDDSDAAMRSGIILKQDLIPFNQMTPDGQNPKEYLKNTIRRSPLALHNGGATDIGTALLVAQEKLLAMDNGNDSAIFLFTDGVTSLDYGKTIEKSLENMDKAAESIHENNIKFCGVFLNNYGTSQSTEVRDIVCKANGIASTGLNLGDMYVEITDASSCSAATDHFMALLGYDFGSTVDPIIMTGSGVQTFRVPGIGVDEANIRIRTTGGVALPDSLDVSFLSPDGTTYEGIDAAALCSVGKTYRVYKLIHPASGTWEVHITFPVGQSMAIEYSPVFSVNVGATNVLEPSEDELHANMDVTVKSYLTQEDSIITDPSAYREYECTLTVTNIKTGEQQITKIEPNNDRQYIHTFPLDYSTYDISVNFECEEIGTTSEKTTINIVNYAPECVAPPVIEPVYSAVHGKHMELDLSEYYNDPEDGKNLDVRLVSTTCNQDAISVENGLLMAKVSSLGDGEVRLAVTDSQNASSELVIQLAPKNTTLGGILALVALLIIAFVIFVFVMRRRKNATGECQLEFAFRGKTVQLKLLPPGMDARRKTDLYTMITSDMAKESGFIREACRAYGVSFEEMRSFLNGVSGEMKRIGVSVVSGRVGKTKVAKVCVKAGQTHVLYNNTCNLPISEELFTFGYYPEEDEGNGGNLFGGGDDFFSSTGSNGGSSELFGSSEFDFSSPGTSSGGSGMDDDWSGAPAGASGQSPSLNDWGFEDL